LKNRRDDVRWRSAAILHRIRVVWPSACAGMTSRQT